MPPPQFFKQWQPAFEMKKELDAKVGLTKPNVPATVPTPPPAAPATAKIMPSLIVDEPETNKQPDSVDEIAPISPEPQSKAPAADEVPVISAPPSPPVTPLPEPPASPPPGPPENSNGDSEMTTLTKAVLVLPTLMHHATQSKEAFPSDPWGEGKMSYKGDCESPRALNDRLGSRLLIAPRHSGFLLTPDRCLVFAGTTPEEARLGKTDRKINNFLYKFVPWMYLIVWLVLVLAYFV